MRVIAPCAVHFLISLMFTVRAVSSTTQWKTLRPTDMVSGWVYSAIETASKKYSFCDSEMTINGLANRDRSQAAMSNVRASAIQPSVSQ